jgi:hypothetical protein
MIAFQSKNQDDGVNGERNDRQSREERNNTETYPRWTRRHPPPKVDEVAGSEFI